MHALDYWETLWQGGTEAQEVPLVKWAVWVVSICKWLTAGMHACMH